MTIYFKERLIIKSFSLLKIIEYQVYFLTDILFSVIFSDKKDRMLSISVI